MSMIFMSFDAQYATFYSDQYYYRHISHPLATIPSNGFQDHRSSKVHLT